MKMLLAVAAGGALGAVARYLVIGQVGHWLGTAFPYVTITVNDLGSFIMGALTETFALVWSPPMELRAFAAVGGLGAFTTVSTFSVDVILLAERGATGQALVCIAASVLLSIAGLWASMQLFRLLL